MAKLQVFYIVNILVMFILFYLFYCYLEETDYVTVSEIQWEYLWKIYSGGPIVEIKELQVP